MKKSSLFQKKQGRFLYLPIYSYKNEKILRRPRRINSRIEKHYSINRQADQPTALSLRMVRKQRVQTYTDLFVPFMFIFTFLTLGFQVLLVFLLEWETLRPKTTDLSQKSHFAIFITSCINKFIVTQFFYRRFKKNFCI